MAGRGGGRREGAPSSLVVAVVVVVVVVVEVVVLVEAVVVVEVVVVRRPSSSSSPCRHPAPAAPHPVAPAPPGAFRGVQVSTDLFGRGIDIERHGGGLSRLLLLLPLLEPRSPTPGTDHDGRSLAIFGPRGPSAGPGSARERLGMRSRSRGKVLRSSGDRRRERITTSDVWVGRAQERGESFRSVPARSQSGPERSGAAAAPGASFGIIEMVASAMVVTAVCPRC